MLSKTWNILTCDIGMNLVTHSRAPDFSGVKHLTSIGYGIPAVTFLIPVKGLPLGRSHSAIVYKFDVIPI